MTTDAASRACVIWLAGLPASGKSTIAAAFKNMLALTGESHAVAKTPEAAAETSVLVLEEAHKLLQKILSG
jgi:adenylylsulfate kinase-like enzyme